MSAVIRFSKMHGLGNDFVVIDSIKQNVNLTAADVRFLADRHRGIGCDQVLLIEKPLQPDTDFFYRIFNADGSEVEQCGNGARCVAVFAREQQLSQKEHLRLHTRTSILELFHQPNGEVRVNMGVPQQIHTVDIENMTGLALSLGNPHVVFSLNDNQTIDLDALGKYCNTNPQFPEGVNVGVMRICHPGQIQLRVYERGVGETQACGSGACAAAIAGIYRDLVTSPVIVELPGGKLIIEWQGNNAPVWMTGPAVAVFKGEIYLKI